MRAIEICMSMTYFESNFTRWTEDVKLQMKGMFQVWFFYVQQMRCISWKFKQKCKIMRNLEPKVWPFSSVCVWEYKMNCMSNQTKPNKKRKISRLEQGNGMSYFFGLSESWLISDIVMMMMIDDGTMNEWMNVLCMTYWFVFLHERMILKIVCG